MKRLDINMTPMLEKFLEFDLGHMDVNKFDNKILDIEYSSNPKLNLDIYFPKGEGPYPVFLIVFGGGWASGFKQDKFVEPMLKPLEYGYACVVADYSLTLDEVYPQNVIDIKHAINFIHQNKKQYNFDDSKIVLWGESAGAHLVLEAGLIPNDELGLNDLNTKVNNIISFYPPIDLTRTNEDCKILNIPFDDSLDEKDTLFGIMMGEHLYDEKYLKLVNPTNYVTKMSPNIIIQHGTKDTIVPYIQSKRFYEYAKKIMGEDNIYYELVEDKVHTDPWFFSNENVKKIIELLK